MKVLTLDRVMMGRWGQISNFVLLHALWLAAVFGAVAGTNLWSVLVLSAMLLLGALLSRHWRRDAAMVCMGAAIGLIFESLLIYSNLIEYELMSYDGLPPLWILALWIGFAQSFNYSLHWLSAHLVLASFLGAVMSIASIFSGIHIGAAEGPYPLILAVVYGVAWACVVPMLALMAGRLSRQQKEKAGDAHHVNDC